MSVGDWIGATVCILSILSVIAGIVAGIRMESIQHQESGE